MLTSGGRTTLAVIAAAIFVSTTGCADDPICGDGRVEDGEACDVGPNGANGGAGCALCVVEAGYSCEGAPSVCTPVCGDAQTVGDEGCDDGNAESGDGCSECEVETGWTCLTAACTPLCGDGRIIGGEACDDQNTGDGDGCSAMCTVEADFTCSGEPSQCASTCVAKTECLGLECGDVDDGCGATIDCGRCTGWFEVRSFGAPSSRRLHRTFWTGTEVIVFGGSGRTGALFDGGRYDPVARTWTLFGLERTDDHYGTGSEVFTGDSILLWGGSTPAGTTNVGWRYDVAGDAWSPMTTNGAPAPRVNPVLVWTGTEMFVFGGADGDPFFDGGLYDPLADTWRPIPTATVAPEARQALWTGTHVYVEGAFAPPVLFDPTTGEWEVVPERPFNVGTRSPIVWTGTEVFSMVSRGDETQAQLFDPASRTWRLTTQLGSPSGRVSDTVVWSGTEVIVWGGRVFDGAVFGDGARYDPVRDVWTPVEMENAPDPRYWHDAGWTDHGMFVWGGLADLITNTGAIYVPD
ncbi:MAG: DUF4215 domain-containing protein [Deltaproteobacteria bacterium]